MRIRHVKLGIVAGFVAAQAFNGLPCDAQITGDDEYAEGDSLRRKLVDAHHINAALEMPSALRAVLSSALHDTRSVAGVRTQAEQMLRTALAKSEGEA